MVALLCLVAYWIGEGWSILIPLLICRWINLGVSLLQSKWTKYLHLKHVDTIDIFIFHLSPLLYERGVADEMINEEDPWSLECWERNTTHNRADEYNEKVRVWHLEVMVARIPWEEQNQDQEPPLLGGQALRLSFSDFPIRILTRSVTCLLSPTSICR